MSLDICLSINTSRFSSVNTTPVHQQLDGLDFGDAYVLSHLFTLQAYSDQIWTTNTSTGS